MKKLPDWVVIIFLGLFVIWSLGMLVSPKFARLVAPIDKLVWTVFAVYNFIWLVKAAIKKRKENRQLLGNKPHEETESEQTTR